MPGIVTDTHALVWYLLGSPRLSVAALQAINAALEHHEPVHVPAICLVEMVYLVEKKRLPGEALVRLLAALDRADSGFIVAPLDRAVAESLVSIARDAVPDMPDRIIAATARHLGLPLVSRDSMIRASGLATVW